MSLPFKRYIVTKPDGSVEFLSEVVYVTRMLSFAVHMSKSDAFWKWCKANDIPYPVSDAEIEDSTFDNLKENHLKGFMESCGYKFEEI